MAQDSSAGFDRPSAEAVAIDVAPQIDGVLEPMVWGAPPDGEMLVQVVPVAGAAPSQRTVFRVLRDRDHVYVGIWCFDTDPDAIRATQVARDAVLDPDDRVEILLDTFGDGQNAFWFQIGPAGGKGDALVSRGGGSFRKDWDGVFAAGSAMTVFGWSAEFALPAATLSFEPANDAWNLNVVRHIRRANESARWSRADPKHQFFDPANAGVLLGVAALEQGHGLDVQPFLAASYRRDSIDRDSEADLGVDVFWRLSPSTKFVLSLNTDFAEAEVDSRQVNLSRFPLFFPEKRDFFLEDDSAFQFGSSQGSFLLPFFSRRIGLLGGVEVPILAAGKFTTRTDSYSIGVIDVETDDLGSVDGQNLGVLRAAAFVGERSQIGLIATNGDPTGVGHSSTFGADAQFRTDSFLGDRNLELNLYAVGAESAAASGGAWFAELDYPNDVVEARIARWQVDDDFDPALGFVSRPGTHRTNARASYEPRLNRDLRRLEFSAAADVVEGEDGGTQSSELTFVPLGGEFESGDEARFVLERSREVLLDPFEIESGVFIAPGDYDWWTAGFELEADDKRPISGELALEVGDFYDGTRTEARAALYFASTSLASFDLEYGYQDIDLPGGSFDVHLGSLGNTLNLSRDVTLRTRLQYDNLSDDVGLDARLRWIFAPGDELFLVIGQSWTALAGSVAPRETQATIKLGWSLRF